MRVGKKGKVKQRFRINQDGAAKSQGRPGEVAGKSRGKWHGGSGIADGEEVGKNGPSWDQLGDQLGTRNGPKMIKN